MSFVFVSTDLLAVTAAELAGVGAAISSADSAVAGSTRQVLAAAGDEVSAAIAAFFGAYGREYQVLSRAGGGVS